MLEHKCPSCGRMIGYEGLCWLCRAEEERREAQAWSAEQVEEKQRRIIENIRALDDWDSQETKDLWKLLSYHGAATPEMQRAALAAGVFGFEQLYYRAPSDVGAGLAKALMASDSSDEAAGLMCCLAMQGGDEALAALLELERSPRAWRKKLYVDPSIYAECGGWTFDKEGRRRELVFARCIPLVKGTPGENEPARLMRPREDFCPHCGCRMVDAVILDGRDERLRFLGVDGVITAACCPNGVGFEDGGAFTRFDLRGGGEPLPNNLTLDDWGNYLGDEGLAELVNNRLVLAERHVPPFYGAYYEGVSTIGGFANWVQDWQYLECPECGRPMKYAAQIEWDMLFDEYGGEGTLYLEICPDCHIAGLLHQQT